jgi:glycine betaine/choline ABC-type transport system substrate-binding protein
MHIQNTPVRPIPEILGHKPKSDARAVYLEAKREYCEKWPLDFSSPLGFSNGFAMLIRGEEASKLGIETLSDAVPYAKQWKAGFGPDFITRSDGWPGLSRTYGLKLAAPPRSLDLGLLNRALSSKQVDLIAGNETDGTIPSLDLFQLKDDKGYFPPYEGVYVLRVQVLKDEPRLLSVLDTLEEAITTEDMQRMNYQVDGLKQRPADVAKEWLDGRKPSSRIIPEIKR